MGAYKLPVIRDQLGREVRLVVTGSDDEPRLRVGEYIYGPDNARQLAKVLTGFFATVTDPAPCTREDCQYPQRYAHTHEADAPPVEKPKRRRK